VPVRGPVLGSIDDRWYLRLNRITAHSTWLHGPMRLVAADGVVVFVALLGVAFVLARRRNDRTMAAALWAPIGVLLAEALNQPLGRAINEPRPYALHPNAVVLLARGHDFSFPSDHGVMAGAVTAGVFLVSWRLGCVAAAAAAVLAFSRVYVGAHYPGDVVAGLAFGAVVMLLGWLIVRRGLTGLVWRLRDHHRFDGVLGAGIRAAARPATEVPATARRGRGSG